MNKFIYKLSNLILSILLWVFIWNIFDILFYEIKTSNTNKLIFYSLCTIVIIVIIYYDKDFFNYA